MPDEVTLEYEQYGDRYTANHPFAGGCRRIGALTAGATQEHVRFNPKYEVFREIDGEHQYIPGVSFDPDII
jgi:hypothetical protein